MQTRSFFAAALAPFVLFVPAVASAQEALAPLPPAQTTAPQSTQGTPAPSDGRAAPDMRAPESPTVAPSIAPSDHRAPFEERAPEAKTPARSYPAIGGHLGTAIPIATFSTKTTTIGSDFVTIGLTPGVTVHLDEHWAIDFEFIAFNELKNTPANTTYIVDPGILRKWNGFVTGLRVATQVGARTNSGVVPILVVPFKIGQRAVWFIEGDIPMFLRDNGQKAVFSVTGQLQTGIGF